MIYWYGIILIVIRTVINQKKNHEKIIGENRYNYRFEVDINRNSLQNLQKKQEFSCKIYKKL